MSSQSEMPEEPLAAPIDVQVQWCGINYTVSVKADGHVGDLKRQTYELVGLPSKRQKHMDTTSKVLNDGYPLGSLPNPPSTDLVGLNNMVEAKIYKNHFHDTRPTCTVDATRDCITDFHGSKTRLSKGTYKVGSMVMDCLIKSYKPENRGDLLRSIRLMRGWKHPKVVVIENLYNEKGKTAPRLVLSNSIDGSLKGYIKAATRKHEDVISNADGTFTAFFKNMIIDLCIVLDETVKRKICPVNLSQENLYLKSIKNADPELKILFDNVAHLDGVVGKQQLTTLFDAIKVICTPNVHKHEGTQEFCNFLGNEARKFVGKNLSKTAAHYPISWTNEQKSKYLIDLMPSSADVRKAINECGISWPVDKDGNMSEELRTLKELVDKENEEIRKEKQPFEKEMSRLNNEMDKIEKEEKDEKIKIVRLAAIEDEFKKNEQAANEVRAERIWNYDVKYAHDLVRLARNLWKHFETLPWSIKSHFKNKEAILDALERWCPRVWFLMYNAVGLGC